MIRKTPRTEKSEPKSIYGSRSIKMELLEVDKWYAFTMNLPVDEKKTVKLCARKYEDVLSEYFILIRGLEFKFYPELSQLGRLHYHGKVLFRKYHTIINFTFMLRELSFNFKFDTIESEQKWDEYIFKQRKYMQPYMETFNYPYELNNKVVKPPPITGSSKALDTYVEYKKA